MKSTVAVIALNDDDFQQYVETLVKDEFSIDSTKSKIITEFHVYYSIIKPARLISYIFNDVLITENAYKNKEVPFICQAIKPCLVGLTLVETAKINSAFDKLVEKCVKEIKKMSTKVEFINNSKLEFKDLSDEQYRVYVFPDMEIKITEPLWLNVSASGGHRIFDSQGNSNYIPAGWRRLYWVVKPGCSNFAF